jgi:hypothetical protein
VTGPGGVDVSPFAGFFDIPPNMDPIDALLNATARLRASKPSFGDGRDHPLEHSIGRRGYSTDPAQSIEYVNYVLIAGCRRGRSQMIVLDTTRDTEAQIDGELRGILRSMRLPVATRDR